MSFHTDLEDFRIGTRPQPEDNLVALTQLHGGGPTMASICLNGGYLNGKLFVDPDGYVIFRQHPPPT